MKQRVTSLVVFFALFAWMACSAWGQQVTAAVTGKVTDSSGAAVANAKVSATSVERGTVYQHHDELGWVLQPVQPYRRNV